MGTVTIRNLDDEVIEHAKERARRHNRSLEAELRTILTHELKPLSPAEFFRLADEIRVISMRCAKTWRGLAPG